MTAPDWLVWAWDGLRIVARWHVRALCGYAVGVFALAVAAVAVMVGTGWRQPFALASVSIGVGVYVGARYALRAWSAWKNPE